MVKSSLIKGKRILVTGGAGFIGSHLVDALVERGAIVTVMDKLSLGKEININEKAKFIKADILDYRQCIKAVEGKDLIFHLAASATTRESSMGWKDPVFDYQVNAIGTLNLLRALSQQSSKAKFLYTSSAAVYGNPEFTPISEDHPLKPISPYGISKLAGEKYCYAYFKEYGINTVILRIFNPYGPRQPRYVMFDLLKKLCENPKELEVLGDGEQARDYCYVSDTVNALILAAEKSQAESIYNVGGGKAITIREVAEKLVKSLGLESETRIYYTGITWRGDVRTLIADISKIQRELSFKPQIGIENGLAKFRDWFLENKKKGKRDSNGRTK
ncbi:GDP-mannose 4,6-dehydratase [Dehalococcoidia bacterium]|nr:GDP-mannose 4,6-dehydratase [Dehalococcoidia bacterium]